MASNFLSFAYFFYIERRLHTHTDIDIHTVYWRNTHTHNEIVHFGTIYHFLERMNTENVKYTQRNVKWNTAHSLLYVLSVDSYMLLKFHASNFVTQPNDGVVECTERRILIPLDGKKTDKN